MTAPPREELKGNGKGQAVDPRQFDPWRAGQERRPAEFRAESSEPDRPDMPEAVLDGRLGEIYQRRLRALPIAYAWPALLTLAGAMLPVDDRAPIRANLFTALVGPVGSGKSVAVDWTRAALGLEEPTFCCLKAGSGEALVRELGDAQGQRRLIYPDELGHLLDKSLIDRASFPRILNSMFYRNRERILMGGKSAVTFDCALSLIGGIVEEDFTNVFGAATVHGLYSRLLYGACPQPFTLGYRPFEGGPEALDPRRVRVDPDVWDARDTIARGAKIDGRIAEIALRAAYICASCDGREALRRSDLGPAIALARYQQVFRDAFRPTEGLTFDARCAARILHSLGSYRRRTAQRGFPGGRMTVRTLQKNTHGNRDFGPAIFKRCVQELIWAGEILADLDAAGRPWVLRLADEEGEAYPHLP